jgi:hypothetical protein
MFCDGAGRPLYPGKVVKEFVWDPAQTAALPSWLTTIGSSPVVSYRGIGAASGFETSVAGLGSAKFATKVTSPTVGDEAGFQTPLINFAEFEEVSWIIQGHSTDAPSTEIDNYPTF